MPTRSVFLPRRTQRARRNKEIGLLDDLARVLFVECFDCPFYARHDMTNDDVISALGHAIRTSLESYLRVLRSEQFSVVHAGTDF